MNSFNIETDETQAHQCTFCAQVAQIAIKDPEQEGVCVCSNCYDKLRNTFEAVALSNRIIQRRMDPYHASYQWFLSQQYPEDFVKALFAPANQFE